jgi:mono/diheme cytochrome c family protein
MECQILRTFAPGAVAAALVASGAALVASQTTAPPVFTAQQATAGRAAYVKSCASCHMPDLSGNAEVPALAGTAFMSTWSPRRTKELFDYMSASMPYGQPSLSTAAYESIAAYLLQSNGAIAGSQSLSASTDVPISSLMPPRASASSGSPSP